MSASSTITGPIFHDLSELQYSGNAVRAFRRVLTRVMTKNIPERHDELIAALYKEGEGLKLEKHDKQLKTAVSHVEACKGQGKVRALKRENADKNPLRNVKTTECYND